MAGNEGFLDVGGAEKSFAGHRVLNGVDIKIARGEFVSLLGPSGCGKTTLLRIVSGLMNPDQGRVTLDGKDITNTPPHLRDVGVVFQNYALFPHLSVAENVRFGLRARKVPKDRHKATIDRFLGLVHMSAFAERPVRGLSGGQQQRVAVARALAVAPKLMLLDEPFSALDRKLRENMQIELKGLLRSLGITTVLVTHDQEEALVMSDRVAVMSRGAIEQFASPSEVYLKPKTDFVLEFVGHSTRIAGTAGPAEGDILAVDTAFGRIFVHAGYTRGSAVTLAVRPERIALGVPPQGDAINYIDAEVKEIIFQGSRIHVLLAGPNAASAMVETSALPPGLAVGTQTTLWWRLEDTLIYPAGAQAA